MRLNPSYQSDLPLQPHPARFSNILEDAWNT